MFIDFYKGIKFALFFIFFVILFFSSLLVYADHLGPEKLVEGKYVVILSLIEEGNAMKLKFFFKDVQTGKQLEIPINFNIKVIDEQKNIIFENQSLHTDKGISEIIYQFPKNGLYKVFLEFEKADEPGKIYKVDAWSIWVPGQKKGFFYPVGMSELAGLALLFLALAVFIANYWWLRKKKQFKKK